MKPSRIAMAALAAAGCSGPYGLMNPPPEPEEPATLPGPPGRGAAPECLPEGSEIAATAHAGTAANDAGTDAVAAAECCPGLTRVGTFKGSILRLDVCQPADDGRAFCVRCGDGKCGVGENFCTCRADCEWPRVDPE